jgi:hypothetical protein
MMQIKWLVTKHTVRPAGSENSALRETAGRNDKAMVMGWRGEMIVHKA